jgi:hypothetical protein
MAIKAWNRRQGRIAHDLALYQFISRNNPQLGEDQSFEAGYLSGRSQVLKTLMRGLFDSDIAGTVINVRDSEFTLILNGAVYNFPGGVLRKLYMGCFPYETAIAINYNTSSQIYYNNVGRINPDSFGDK